MRNSWRGFSVIELIFTLVISSLLVTIAVSNWHTFLERQIHQTQVSQIFHSLQFARLEAIKRHQSVIICGTQDFIHCEKNWSNGFMVFTHQKNTLDILRQEKFEKRNVVHSGQLKMIRYGAFGQCLTRGTITVATPHKSTRIVLYDSGRARISE